MFTATRYFVVVSCLLAMCLLAIGISVQDWALLEKPQQDSSGWASIASTNCGFFKCPATGKHKPPRFFEWGKFVTDYFLGFQALVLMLVGPGPTMASRVLRFACFLTFAACVTEGVYYEMSDATRSLKLASLGFNVFAGIFLLYAAHLTLVEQGKEKLITTSKRITAVFSTFLLMVVSVMVTAKMKGRVNDSFLTRVLIAKRALTHLPLACYGAAGGALGPAFGLFICYAVSESVRTSRAAPFKQSIDFDEEAMANTIQLLSFACVALMFEEAGALSTSFAMSRGEAGYSGYSGYNDEGRLSWWRGVEASPYEKASLVDRDMEADQCLCGVGGGEVCASPTRQPGRPGRPGPGRGPRMVYADPGY